MSSMLVRRRAGVKPPGARDRQAAGPAAALPAVPMGFGVLRLVVETARDPTSHDLWPFDVLIYGTARRWLHVW